MFLASLGFPKSIGLLSHRTHRTAGTDIDQEMRRYQILRQV
jgi:hypothetical protein